MPKIDVFLKSIVRFGAKGATLISGRKVALLFETGPRFANQSIPHQDLVTLVLDAASPEATEQLRQRKSTTFEYGFGGEIYSVDVQVSPTTWQVNVTPMPEVELGQMPLDPNAIDLSDDTPAPAESPPSALRIPKAPPKKAEISPAGALDKLLAMMAENGASDLHLAAGCRPFMRIHGDIVRLTDFPRLSAQDLTQQLDNLTPERNLKEYAGHNDTDFAYALPKARYRVNRFKDRRGPGAVFRTVPLEILTPEQLGLPSGVMGLCTLTKGLVVVTGPTGSGKSTTLAAMVDHINRTRRDHIITIEDPIEFIHENKGCLVNQRQVRLHTDSFKDALRAALREDPDIVMVGEMRDLETVAIAVETAETGHLVFGTLHTTTAPATVDRIIDQFPADRQEQVREMLAESLRGVIAQTLCRKVGGGRVAAYEVLLYTAAVANLIRERKSYQLPSLMQTNRNKGMITLNDSLMELVRQELVEPAEALSKTVNRDELGTMMRRAGIQLPASMEKDHRAG